MASKNVPQKSVVAPKKPVVHGRPKTVIPDAVVGWRDVEYDDRGDYEAAKLAAELEDKE